MRLARHAFAVAALTLAGASAAQAQVKVAFINSQEILNRTPGRAAAEAQLDKDLAPLRQQMQRMQDSLQTMAAQYDSSESKLTADQRTAQQTALRAKNEEFTQRMQTLQQQATQREDELVRPIMDMVKRALDDERSSNGYTMIFDLAAQNSPIVAFDKNLDITERILSRLATMKPAPVAPRPNADAGSTGGASTGTPSRPATNTARPAGATPAPSGVSRPKPPTR